MIQTKYLIMIGAIVCLLILYYLYHEISNVKKSFIPAYQKTMSLEARIIELEKKSNENIPKKKINPKIDSPALSITYQSDMAKNGNLSVMYADLSESEAKRLVKNIEKNQNKEQPQVTIQTVPKNVGISNVPTGEISDFKEKTENIWDKLEMGKIASPFGPGDTNIGNYKINKDGCIVAEDTDTINVKICDLVKKNTPKSTYNCGGANSDENNEYHQILNGLSKNVENTFQDEHLFDSDELDPDIIRSISESIHHADMPSDNISELPVVKPTKKKNVTSGKNNKKVTKKKQTKNTQKKSQ